ncbi:MAG: ROK family protein [Cellulosilyticaceae bacterium]
MAIKKCKLIYENLNTSILRQLVSNPDDITIHHIILAYQMGDPLVCNIISDMINYLSITLSNIMIINNPSKILFHSEIFENESIKQQLLSSITHQLDFIDNDLCNTFEVLPYSINKGAVGAAALAINAFFM